MQLSENWFVDAPWAQLLCSTKIPDDALQKFIAMSDDILDCFFSAANDILFSYIIVLFVYISVL